MSDYQVNEGAMKEGFQEPYLEAIKEDQDHHRVLTS